MKLVLYNNYSEECALTKTLVKIEELTGTLRNESSIINPTILVEFHPENYPGYVVENNQQYIVINGIKITWDNYISQYILSANYAYIPEFSRYYYIIDIISVNQHLWRINMRCDVLMSFKDEILATECFVARNENTYDPMVRDDLVSFYYDKDVTEYIPDSGGKVNTTFDTNILPTKDNSVVTVINQSLAITLTTENSPSTVLPSVGGWVTGTGTTSQPYAIYPTELNKLALELLAHTSYASFVLSIVTYPFEIPTTQNSTQALELGTTTTSVNVELLSKNQANYLVVGDFTITGSDFMDYEPYSLYEIYLPYLGWISLSAENILNKRLLVVYVVDYSTGSAQVSVIDDTSGKVLYTSTTQLGISLPVNNTNATEVENNKLTNNIGLGLGLASSAITTIAGIATYNPIAIAGGVMGTASTVSKYIQNSNTNYSKASGSVASGQAGVYLPQKVRVRKTVMKPKGYDSDYFKLHGRPLNKYETLSNLTGFTVVGSVHLENFGNATSTELNQIESLLKDGIII